MTLRRIEPLGPSSLRGIVIDPEAGEPPELRWVDPTTLLVDEVYQRRIGEAGIALIRRSLEDFDWASVSAIKAVETEEGLKVTDGQHTAVILATHPGVTLAPVLVTRDLAIRGQAKAFVDHNSNRIAVTRTQLHHSRLVARDGDAILLDRACTGANVRVLKNPPANGGYVAGDTIAVGTLGSILKRRGIEFLTEILALLQTRSPITATELRAVELLRFDPDYRCDWDADSVGAIVAASSGYELREAEAIAATRRRPNYVVLAMVWYRRVPRKVSASVLVKR